MHLKVPMYVYIYRVLCREDLCDEACTLNAISQRSHPNHPKLRIILTSEAICASLTTHIHTA